MDRDNQGIIAKKYAKAFIELFSNHLLQPDELVQGIDKIETFIAYLNDHRKSLLFADLKLITIEKRQEIFHNLIDTFGLNLEFKKLTDLLVVHQRIFLLQDILKLIIKLYLDKINVIPFKVFSSHSISAVQENALIKFLESKSNKKVIIKSQLDKSLIAGLKAISTDFEWEHSIRQKLSLLNQT